MSATKGGLSGPLNLLNAYYLCFSSSTAIGPFCDRERDWEALSPLSRIHAQVGALNRLVLNRFMGLNRAIVVL